MTLPYLSPCQGLLAWRASILNFSTRSIIFMAVLKLLCILVVLLFGTLLANFAHCALADTRNCTCDCTGLPISRSSFPQNFQFGTAGSSYQMEGAWNRDGKGPNIWDTYTHLYPDLILDGSNGDVAIAAYDLYERDVTTLKHLGVDMYRFSISWARVMPEGQLSKGVSQLGLKYYSNLIDRLLDKGIKPCVTMFHWDAPQALEDLYGGFRSPRIVEDFRNYADLLFKTYGDKVHYWLTFNEPWTFSSAGYAVGDQAPGRCTYWLHPNCTGGDSGTEPYVVTHHQLLAHAAAFHLYKQKYQATQNGRIGIALVSQWFLPYRAGNGYDLRAAQIAMDFLFGWFMDPLVHGRYPRSMVERVGERLPKFTKLESQMVKKSYDYIGLNYYTAQFAHFNYSDPPYPNYVTDSRVNLTGVDVNEHPVGLGPAPGSPWPPLYPVGLKNVLNYTKVVYDDPPILITENGAATNSSLSKQQSLNDTSRIEYLDTHMCCLLHAINECQVNVFGYLVWSMFDNFEWSQGYTARFGLYYVDYENGLVRTPKKSAQWYKKAIAHKPHQSDQSSSLITEYPMMNNRKVSAE